MNSIRLFAIGLMGLSLSACASVDTATRNAPMENVPTEIAETAPSFDVVDFQIDVPRSLKVSEANLFYPVGDIVWRGEPRGDRYQQIGAIFEDSLYLGINGVQGDLPVKVVITLKRFHALTEKTRYSVGGVHSITFDMTIVDPLSGNVIRGPKEIKADLVGYGGQKALEAEARGLTQKYRITHHLARVLRDELTLAHGFLPPRGGVTKRITPVLPVTSAAASTQQLVPITEG